MVAHTGNEGGYADHALVSAAVVSEVPAGVDLQVAAAVLHTGIAAVQMSDADLQRYPDRALREAAAGIVAPVIGQTFPLVLAGPPMPRSRAATSSARPC